MYNGYYTMEQSQSHFPQKQVQAQMSGYLFQAEIPITTHQDMASPPTCRFIF